MHVAFLMSNFFLSNLALNHFKIYELLAVH